MKSISDSIHQFSLLKECRQSSFGPDTYLLMLCLPRSSDEQRPQNQVGSMP